MRILLADDDADVRLLWRLMVESHPGNVVVAEAGDGEEAVALYQRHRVDGPIDLVVLDMAMPRLSGIEALAKIRAQDQDVPAVIVTAFADEVTSATRRSCGCAVLDKLDADVLDTLLAPS